MKQSHYVTCPVLELLCNSLGSPLTRKFGDPWCTYTSLECWLNKRSGHCWDIWQCVFHSIKLGLRDNNCKCSWKGLSNGSCVQFALLILPSSDSIDDVIKWCIGISNQEDRDGDLYTKPIKVSSQNKVQLHIMLVFFLSNIVLKRDYLLTPLVFWVSFTPQLDS